MGVGRPVGRQRPAVRDVGTPLLSLCLIFFVRLLAEECASPFDFVRCGVSFILHYFVLFYSVLPLTERVKFRRRVCGVCLPWQAAPFFTGVCPSCPDGESDGRCD
eukprot:NODE_6201_length_465_cov_103.634615_g4692_i0.p1 GENE.NODE_6201_length_465_cov_103.634615_g4692_i0~~NODE_6201_length_465_cov_103.634615_g4692_i0.p1  ORF type:complete len:112 (+),score=20.20 NODE_6201_length_465_cov_103.634615_g4692_i0:23-337(+)